GAGGWVVAGYLLEGLVDIPLAGPCIECRPHADDHLRLLGVLRDQGSQAHERGDAGIESRGGTGALASVSGLGAGERVDVGAAVGTRRDLLAPLLRPPDVFRSIS